MLNNTANDQLRLMQSGLSIVYTLLNPCITSDVRNVERKLLLKLWSLKFSIYLTYFLELDLQPLTDVSEHN